MLRQRVTTDIATKGGQFDVLTIGTYEVPIWAKKGWLVPLANLGADYDVADLLPKIRDAVSVDGKLYAAPFYGESSMVMYRTDLFDKAGLKMPEKPTWDFVIDARQEADRQERRHLRHLPARQGRLGREHGVPLGHGQFLRRALVRREVGAAVQHAGMEDDAHDLRQSDEGCRPSRRELERLQREPCAVQRRQVRRCGSTRRSRRPSSPIRRNPRSPTRSASRSRPTPGSARTPTGCGPGASRSPPAPKKTEAAEKFIAWATSKDYTKLVASKDGWANVPPGTRTSLYQNPDYLKVAPFAKLTLASIDAADPNKPTVKPVPYVGVQYAAIPEFQGIGTQVGQQFSAALAGSTSGRCGALPPRNPRPSAR